MVQNLLVKILLLPFSLLYGLASYIWNAMYDFGFLDATSFTVPVINVGNLTVGGSGKTPHTEYLIRLLRPYLEVAVLSRGYKRKTREFREVFLRDTVISVGDEPLLYKRKYSDIGVFVAISRSEGIPALLMKKPGTQIILLDDAYQHRAVKPGMNILLTLYDQPFFRDFYLPSGRLREWRSSYRRANVIIVSKCPENLSQVQKDNFLSRLNPLPHQKVFFTSYHYFRPYYMYDPARTIELNDKWHVLLVSAIASSTYLLQYLYEQVEELDIMEYVDHHVFTPHELSQIKRQFDQIQSPHKIILTTEKDATRLDLHRKYIIEEKIPVFVLPVDVKFLFGQKEEFNDHIRNYLLEFKV